jgi:hypothetical protein
MTTQLWTTIPVPGARVRAVPGGWLVTELEHREVRPPGERARVEIVALGSSFVADPTAPHCQPAQSPVGPPPMTDDDLIAWLTATYGEPVHQPVRHVMTWHIIDVEFDGRMDGAARWEMPSLDGYTDQHPAHIAGPALWAAQHFGGTP